LKLIFHSTRDNGIQIPMLYQLTENIKKCADKNDVVHCHNLYAGRGTSRLADARHRSTSQWDPTNSQGNSGDVISKRIG
jgi:hypothetical protein